MARNQSSPFLTTVGIITAGTITLFSAGASAETGRYTMTPTKDGVLKLDTRTGAVSLCSRSSGDWSCKSVDSDGQDRIRQLEKENARLRARLADRHLAPGSNDGGKMEMPSEEDVDKAMDFMERLLHRFKGMVEDLKKDKKEENGVPL
jgi:hypothetical protein